MLPEPLGHVSPLVKALAGFPAEFLGGIAFVVFAARYALHEQRRDLRMMSVALLTTGGGMLCSILAFKAADYRLMRYDLFIYRIDGLLGFEPSFVLGRVLLPHLWAAYAIQIVYGLLPAVVMVVLAGYLWRPSPDARRPVTAFLLNVLIAPLFYFALPVSGPQFAFPTFPALPGMVVAHLIPIHAAPNGVPSVHCSTALLIWWYARRWRWGGVFGCVFAALTIIATLASGQHYLFDLLAAVPFSAAMVRIAEHFGNRAARVEEAEMVPA